jgi:hypothetical protein
MDKIPEKAILSFAQLQLPGVEFAIETHHDKHYLMLVVDCAKFDKNSDEYDESYRNLLYKERPKDAHIWISNPINKIGNINLEIGKFFGIRLEVSFSFKNYDYIDPIDEKIKRAILQSSKPDVKFEFDGDGTSPMLRCNFTNYPRSENRQITGTKEYIEELENLMNGEVLINNNYSWSFRQK